MNWKECEDCGEEFRVITDSHNDVQYCPLCGSPLPIVDEDEDDEERDEDDDE
jgi:rRNA maturation endonuclease Nob1